MKTTIVKPSTLRKHLAFRSQLLVLTLLWCSVFYTNPVLATDTPYGKTPPKVTSSIDCLPPVNLAAIQPTRSGRWNDASIWPGNRLPNANDDVTIPSGRTVTLAGTCRAKSIRVNGVLNAANQSINLESQSIVVAGRMEIGTPTNPYQAAGKCLITLKGDKRNNAPSSHKAILVIGGGTLEMHGKKRLSWTNLSATANAGSRQITLKRAVNWEVGDVIALTSTALANKNGRTWEQVDQVQIQSISGDRRTLTLTTALKHKHIGGSKTYTRPTDGKKWTVNIQGEVGLLSHYIKVQGDESNDGRGYGGHIMLMKNSMAHVENIELYRMGQKGILGRYPFHWHLNEDKAKGSYLRNSSVHKSFNRAVTIHGTDYVTIDGVFAYDHIGHGIFLEDGGERFNTIKNNVVFLTRRPSNADRLTPSDNSDDSPQNRTPASFWITNPNNYFENNVAAGTEGTGFWFAFPERPMLDSSNLPYFQGMNPTTQPLGRMDGFVAHTCMNGWDVFDQLNPDHSLKTNHGWNINSRQLIKGGLFYGNDQAIYCGLGNSENIYTVFYDCAFSDNKTTTMLAGDLTIENSLFNADSDLGVFTGTREFFRFYDGPGRHFDCHFEGWNRPNTEMIKQITGGGATENFNPSFRGITKGFSEPFPFRFFALPNNADTRTRKVGQFFKDYDGSLLGKKGTLIRDIPFLRDGHEYRHSSWKNAARSDYYFAGLWFAGINASGTRISIVRSKPGTDNVCFYESGNKASGTYKFPMIVNEDFMYTYYLDRAPSNKSIHLIWNRGDNGDTGFACFKGLGKLGNFRVNPHKFSLPRRNSRAAVQNSTDTGYFIDGNGDVYIRFKSASANPHDRVNIFLNWDNNGSFNPPGLPCTTNDLTPGDNNNPNNPPTASFQSPTENRFEVGDDLGVVVNATDSDGTIANVRLYLNNTLVRQEGGAPYEWGAANPNANDTPLLNLAAGTYILRAVATDNDGESATITKTITVGDSGPVAPVVSFQSPTGNQFEVGHDLSVVVNATDSDGTIANVQLYLNEQFIRQEGGAPYEWGAANPNANDTPLLNLAAGNYVLTAIATDNDGESTTVTKTITVSGSNQDTTITFISPTQTQYEEGDDVGVEIAVTKGSVSNIRLYLNDTFVRQEGFAPYEWGTEHPGQGIDPLLRNLKPGTYQLRAVATDSGGGTQTITRTINVGGGSSNGGNPIVHIRKRNASGYALDGGNGGVRDQSVALWQANSNNVNQQWIEIDQGNGYYSYRKRNTNYCIDGGNGGALRQNIILWDCANNNQNQHWRKVSVGNNIYRLEKRNASSYSIDGNNGGENGRATYLWQNGNANQNQHWIFEVIGTSNDKNKEPIAADLLILYPNPVTNTLFISGNTSNKLIQIYDILGAVKISKVLSEGENSIDFSSLSSGYYLAKVKNTDNSGRPDQVIKILKN